MNVHGVTTQNTTTDNEKNIPQMEENKIVQEERRNTCAGGIFVARNTAGLYAANP